jgi:hypothetical protein
MKQAIGLACLCLLIQQTHLPAQDQQCAAGELRTDATPNCISIEWDVTGDTDHDATCRVAYREQGTREWKQAFPLLRVDYKWWYHEQEAERPFDMLAGSILHLKPGTTYEVKLDLSDPDGGQEAKVFSIPTRPLPQLPTGGQALHVVPGAGGGSGAKDDPFRGLEAAQKQAAAGDTLLLHEGRYGSFTFDKPGEAGKYLVWRAAGDGDVVLDHVQVQADHLWLEGLMLKRDQQANGLRAVGKAQDVVVRRNDFQGFHYSIYLSPECRNWHITDNVIVGDNDPNQPTGEGGISGEGVELNHSGGHVVACNRISHVADGVSYPERNVDIFGNDIFDVSDDGLEADRGYANVRMWGNRITNAKNNAISFQPMRCGPWYIVRNLVVGKGSIFKFRVQDRFVLVGNTFVRWGSIGNRMHHILTSFSRNNLYISADGKGPVWTAIDCNQPQYCLPNNYQPNWMTDVDYDGFDWGDSPQAFRWENNKRFTDLESFSKSVGIERHGRRVRKEEIFESWKIPAEPARVTPLHLPLHSGSAAVDAGEAVPNIADDFTGSAPDLGAYESGKPLPHYGPRK